MLSSVSGVPTSALAASAALIVDPPTPVSAMPALVTEPPAISSETATPTVAKSPTRRSSFRYPPARMPCAGGITASTTISSRSSTFSNGPVTKAAIGMERRPRGPCATTEPPSASTTDAQSPCGSAWQSDPTSVPRLRTIGSAISGAAAAMVGWVARSSSERSRSTCRHSAPIRSVPSASAWW